MIDLGRWFNEEIGVPHEGDSGDVPVEYRDEEHGHDDDDDSHRNRAYRYGDEDDGEDGRH